MKLLTANTHSLVEKDYKKKLNYFVDFICKNDYDIVAMQEVNQSISAKQVLMNIKNQEIVIREDNHILNVVKGLSEKGKKYYWAWEPIKIGYDKYDEGIGIISKHKILETKSFYITLDRDYKNWRTRKVLGIKTYIDGENIWFFSIHMGWWKDEDGFRSQFKKLETNIKEIVKPGETVYLMGDFNNPADVRNEGYDEIVKSWNDTYDLAKNKDDGITVEGLIDGWKEYKNIENMRIDFIFVNKKENIQSSRVVCNGKQGEIVSDHYFVEIVK